MSMPINLTWKVSIRRIRCILYLFRTNDNISQSNNPNLQQASSLTALATISRSVKRIITTDTFSKVCSSTCWKQRHLNKYNIELFFSRRHFKLVLVNFFRKSTSNRSVEYTEKLKAQREAWNINIGNTTSEGKSTLGQFAASARFDGDVRSQTSGGISAVQRHQRLRAPENSNCPAEKKLLFRRKNVE